METMDYQNIGNVKPAVSDLTSCTIFCKLSRFDWYWGDIKRLEAEALVVKNPGTFLIRASKSPFDLLCITFLSDFSDTKASTTSMSKNNQSSKSVIKNNTITHMRLQHYKGLFSLDKKNYVPLEDVPQHCASFGRVNDVFRAQALKRNANSRLILTRSLCKEHSDCNYDLNSEYLKWQSSSPADSSPLLDIGLSHGAPQHSVFGPSAASDPFVVVRPTCLRTPYSTFPRPWSPFEDASNPALTELESQYVNLNMY